MVPCGLNREGKHRLYTVINVDSFANYLAKRGAAGIAVAAGVDEIRRGRLPISCGVPGTRCEAFGASACGSLPRREDEWRPAGSSDIFEKPFERVEKSHWLRALRKICFQQSVAFILEIQRSERTGFFARSYSATERRHFRRRQKGRGGRKTHVAKRIEGFFFQTPLPFSTEDDC